MLALRYFPKEKNKLVLANLENGSDGTEYIIKKPDEVVIQVYNAGLCGTDLHIVQVARYSNRIKCYYKKIIKISVIWLSWTYAIFHLNLQGEFKTKNTNPITLGHEFSGKIVAVGDLAKEKFDIGDNVAVDPNRCKLKI